VYRDVASDVTRRRAVRAVAHIASRESARPVYDWFTERFDSKDFEDLKALLSEVA
jgi:hypothetical protein